MRANKPSEAAKAYSTALSLSPGKQELIQIQRGKALIATGDDAAIRQAVKEIREALRRDGDNPDAYFHLAQAYGRLGDVAEAELATAEAHFYSASYKEARIFAARAQQKFKTGAPGWVRAQDIINMKPPRK